MLQVARLSPKLLGDSAPLVHGFLESQRSANGGFIDRGGSSDLYYTVFGIDSLIALRAEFPVEPLVAYLHSFGSGESLDLVHLACLARGWSAIPAALRAQAPVDRILAILETHRAADGGYHPSRGAERGTIYGCFLAWGAYQDLGHPMPQPERIADCLAHLKAADGGYSNQDDMPLGLTPPTAAAATLMRQLGRPIEATTQAWLLARCTAEGGFLAHPDAPLPDLLSTATALHALVGMHADLDPIAEPCLDFVDSLWTNRGSFYGHWGDDQLDCEYTYYGLLALGHLSF
ncbi:MAG TPA: prenyltransferase/squalene oxidase repeat-containing protein [Pirellulales bacterium]|jgi:hypothetical protein|nr:prenyltransferase/squalene oxidase repeat-containing protein [Pirellulales bacterium]